ncbi:hypothetical protein [Actinomadura sp. DC4]|uniref:hypothetical protein n=1 Tax=Actinomadura sp. DC4 TaxID=3055069 RepID=UPI0025B0C812|nr:hypothetical protein [Actinomadura sp. DC4]MDN3354084.1 hypothetical protein [Actinomadura sp. DC4]
MQDGLVVAASTPVAPGIESLLLRSGRVSEESWREVFDEAAPYGRLSAELVERGLLGAAAVEVLTQTAVFDAIFAIAVCGISSCTAESAAPDDLAPLLPVQPGLDPDRVVRETARRLDVAAEWQRFGLNINTRPQRLPVEHSAATAPARAEILAKINGRLSTRDIAFSLGRGLYSVLTDLAILMKDGLIAIDPAPADRRRVDPAQIGTVRLDEIPIDELSLGELSPTAPAPVLPPAPRPPQGAELPRRRRMSRKRPAPPSEDA